MTSTVAKEELMRLHGIMTAMLDVANRANWQELSRLDSERRVLLDFNNQRGGINTIPPTTVDEEFQTLTRQLLELDEQINETVLKARAKIINANREFREQSAAKQGYASTYAI